MDSICTKGVKNLVFVHADMVQTTVPATLSSGRWAKGQHEFKVEVVIAEFSFAPYVRAIRIEESCLLIDASAFPLVFIAPIKKNNGFLG